ncbi:MAG TPA: hypothetical protein VG275_01760 [Solirubrobacteraceae bacterium]|jgi:hypothetical protein|nr:hypothetical protein [Solirubrobacteraceae bacterium]
MSWIGRAALAVWDFVVGDDWRVALGVVAAIALTALVADSTVAAWWVLPIAVVVLLLDSLRRAARR